jgi:hypothetical protein
LKIVRDVGADACFGDVLSLAVRNHG